MFEAFVMDGKTMLLGLAGFLTGLASAFLAGVVAMSVVASYDSEMMNSPEIPPALICIVAGVL